MSVLQRNGVATPSLSQSVSVADRTIREMPVALGRISVIMPAYNEEEHIYQSVMTTVQALRGLDTEIIVVDDGSRDATAEEAGRAMAEMKQVRLVTYEVNGGKGHALRQGFNIATGEFVAFLDADLDLCPSQIHSLMRTIKRDHVDVAIGSKRHPQSQLDYPWHRRMMSYFYYLLTRVMFGLPVHDTQTGIKLFRREVLEETLPRIVVKRFAYDLELLMVAHMLGFAIAEVPVRLDFQRENGRINAKDVWWVWWDTMAIFYRRYFLRYYSES